MMVRLVKGAYWDTEVKRAQERGLDDYPVFTRKAMTDLNYMACAEKLLALRPRIYPAIRHPQRAHRRLDHRARGRHRGLRVPAPARHGRGALRAADRGRCRASPAAPMRRSAATATSSPISCAACWRTAPTPPSCRWRPIPNVPVEALLKRPADIIVSPDKARHPKVPLPRDLYGPERANSRGVEFGHQASLDGAAGRDRDERAAKLQGRAADRRQGGLRHGAPGRRAPSTARPSSGR